MTSVFTAVDGESFTVDGEHRYVLMAASTGQYIYSPKGLPTESCFEFLFSLPRKRVNVAYGWNYDVNMMLGDVDTETLIRLWHEGKAHWQGYVIEWIPNKWFHLRDGKAHVRVNDTFGFFQASFINALTKWNLQIPEGMSEMKQSRSLFTKAMRDDVIGYCIDECVSLVDLMDELEIALHSVGLRVRSWIGAGAIASALLTANGIKTAHCWDTEYAPELQQALRNAYFGGRSELFQQGEFPKLYDYDISSAYPSESMKLPWLKGGKWKHVHHYYDSAEYAVWHCKWNLPLDDVLMPFPFRHKGDIFYPAIGEGWYHAQEVRAAQTLTNDSIQVIEGWIFEPPNDRNPFDWVEPMYQHRAELKRNGHAGEKVLKLGLNAIYGKLAQGYGYKGKLPPFQSYFWAGMITAGTRARILDMAMYATRDLVMVATDGIFFTKPIPIAPVQGLGGIELTVMDDVFVAQPGVYHAYVDGEGYGRSRGFFSKEIDFDDLRHGFTEEGPLYVGHYKSERFCGLGYALLSHNLTNWRRWAKTDRKLSLYPSRKFLSDIDPPNGTVRHYPPAFPEGASEPYVPKRGNVQLNQNTLWQLLDFIHGTEQPLRDYDMEDITYGRKSVQSKGHP